MLPAGKLTWKTGFGYSPPLTTCVSLGCCGSCQVSPDNEGERRSVVPDSLQPHGLYSPWGSSGQNTGVGSLSLLQEVFPTQGSNPGLPHCRQILYQLSYQGNLSSIPELGRSPGEGKVYPLQYSGLENSMDFNI